MRKSRYRCRRYFFYVPVAIGEKVDRSVDYLIKLFGPLIVLVPKGMEFPLSTLDKARNCYPQNHTIQTGSSTVSLLKDSKIRDQSE